MQPKQDWSGRIHWHSNIGKNLLPQFITQFRISARHTVFCLSFMQLITTFCVIFFPSALLSYVFLTLHSSLGKFKPGEKIARVIGTPFFMQLLILEFFGFSFTAFMYTGKVDQVLLGELKQPYLSTSFGVKLRSGYKLKTQTN